MGMGGDDIADQRGGRLVLRLAQNAQLTPTCDAAAARPKTTQVSTETPEKNIAQRISAFCGEMLSPGGGRKAA